MEDHLKTKEEEEIDNQEICDFEDNDGDSINNINKMKKN